MPDRTAYWHHYWNNDSQIHESDALRQVGKTVGGMPISDAQLADIVASIRTRLMLTAEDTLLDLCCGNGVITARLAVSCQHVTGVDFSSPLLSVARARFAPPGVDYVLADVSALPPEILHRGYGKVCMHEGLQHLETGQVERLLAQFHETRPLMLLGAVPDIARIDHFYNTPERRAEYDRRRAAGDEPIGRWWSRDEIATLAKNNGYAAEFLDLPPGSHGAHYRFDARLVQERKS